MVRARASLGRAQKDRGERQWRGSLAACGDRGQSEQPAEACWRVRIIPLTADGLDTAEIMRRTGKSKSVVWRWQKRFMHAGVDGLLRQDPTLAQAAARPGADRVCG
jgi:Homeodomain-like domain-containing protein